MRVATMSFLQLQSSTFHLARRMHRSNVFYGHGSESPANVPDPFFEEYDLLASTKLSEASEILKTAVDDRY